jgi:thioredoxin-like negative regulator of GroEL
MTPIVDGLEEEFSGQVLVTRLDAAQPENAELQTQFGLRGHPSFAVLDRNRQVSELFFGPQEENTLRQAMAQVADS